MRYFFTKLSIFLFVLYGCTTGEYNSETRNDFLYNSSASNLSQKSADENNYIKGDYIFHHSSNKGKIYHHDNFSFSYSEEDEQSEWVAYELTREETKGKLKRKELFTEDPIVVSESSHPYEYRESGYTKGHLAPSGDMKFDETAMIECFYTSNISPQKQKFNAGIWNDLEMQVRYWAQKFGTIYVITGPILENDCPKMTYTNNRGKVENSNITIPDKFYKIVYDFSLEGKKKMIGFVIPQEGAKGSFFNYATTVDKIESMTGIDFFQNISHAEQEEFESKIDLPKWEKFTYINKYNNQ